MAFHWEPASQNDGFAVDMRRPFVFPGNHRPPRAHSLHKSVLSYKAGHHVETEHGFLKPVAGAHHRDVKQAVANGRIPWP